MPLCLLVWCLAWSLTLPAAGADVAEEETGSEAVGERMPEEFGDLLGSLPDEIAELLPPGLFSEDSGEVNEAVSEMSGFSYLLRSLLATVGLRLDDCLRMLAAVIGLLLLSAVFGTLRASFRSESVGRAFSFGATLAVFGALVTQAFACIRSVTGYLTVLNRLTAAAVPLMGVLYAMGGNVTTAAASAGGLTVYMTLLEQFVGRSVVPFCGLCLAFALIGIPETGVRLGTLLATFKKQYTTVLTFLMMLLLAMLAAQTTLAAKADTLAMRSAKFAAGNLIPVVGGSVSELIRTVSAGVGYLRGTVGICGVLLILLSLFPTLVELLLYRLVWQIGASVADMLGCDGERRLLDETASLTGYLIAAVSICSSVLLLAMTVLAHCTSAIG